MDRIAKLFGGMSFVRVARLFLLHPGVVYDTRTLREKAHLDPADLRIIVNDLAGASVIKRRGNKWILNDACAFLKPLRDLLIGQLLAAINLAKRVERCGSVKLLIAAGVFLDESESRTDLLLVAERLNPKMLQKIVAGLEADVGSEVRYAVFTPVEFA